MSDRVHPTGAPPDSPNSTISSNSNKNNFAPKPAPPPGHYYIQVPKDQIYKVPPPENAALFASYTKRSAKRSSRCRRLICTFVFAVLFALFVAGAVAGALYLAFRPKIPKYDISALSADGFNFSGDGEISPAIAADFRAENPNSKIGVYYRDGSDISVYYNGVELCSGSWPVFFQPRRNVTVFRTRLVGSRVLLGEADREGLVKAQKDGAVPLRVDFRVPVRVKFGAVTTWTVTVKVGCDVVVSDLKSDSRVVSQECKVRVKVL